MVNVVEPIDDQRRRRQARATRSVVAGAAFQGAYIVCQFVILAVLFRALGEERFGMWVTVFGLTIWLFLLPLGCDRAALTWLGQVAFHRPAMVWRVLGGLMTVTAITSAVAVAAIVLLGPQLPWERILNVTGDQAVREAAPVATWALATAAIAMPAAVAGMVLQAFQRGGTRHVLGIVAQAVGLALLLFGVYRGWPLRVLGAVIVSPILIAGLLQWLATWPLLPPRPTGHPHPERAVGSLLTMGMGFWVVQVLLLLTINSGPLVVAQVSGAAAVAPYAAVYRLVGPLVVMFLMINQAYWPAFGDAAAAKDRDWIVGALRRSVLAIVLLMTIGGAFCLLVGRPFIVWWLGPEAEPTLSLIVCGLVFALAQGLFQWTTAALSGLGRVRVQAVAALVMLAGYGGATYALAGVLDARGVFLLQACVIGAFSLVNGVHLWRVVHRTAAPDAADDTDGPGPEERNT